MFLSEVLPGRHLGGLRTRKLGQSPLNQSLIYTWYWYRPVDQPKFLIYGNSSYRISHQRTNPVLESLGVWSAPRRSLGIQRCSTVNSDICTHHECHFTAGNGHFGLLSAVPRRVHLPQGHASPHKGSDIDQGISADTTGAPAILLEDSRPQAILKLRPPNSLDYSTRYGCQRKVILFTGVL